MSKNNNQKKHMKRDMKIAIRLDMTLVINMVMKTLKLVMLFGSRQQQKVESSGYINKSSECSCDGSLLVELLWRLDL